MESQRAKVAVLGDYLFNRGCFAGVTEGPWNSDVWLITKNGYSIDVEIKVQRGDLLNELNTIARVLDDKDYGTKLRQRHVKYEKHEAYLKNRHWDRSILNHRPNSFYFAIPSELLDRRMEMLRGTPYGILLITPNDTIEVYKKAEKLHTNKTTDEEMIKLLRKACTESYYLRSKLLTKGVLYEDHPTE